MFLTIDQLGAKILGTIYLIAGFATSLAIQSNFDPKGAMPWTVQAVIFLIALLLIAGNIQLYVRASKPKTRKQRQKPAGERYLNPAMATFGFVGGLFLQLLGKLVLIGV